MEIWKTVYHGGKATKYEVSSLGKLRNKEKEELLTDKVINEGYLSNGLSLGNKRTATIKRHTAVAAAFVPNLDQKKYVIHLNGVTVDNRRENLAWADGRGQCTYATDKEGDHYGISFRVRQINMDGNPDIIWNSISEAAGHTKVTTTAITKAVYQSAVLNGMRWEYGIKNLAEELWFPLCFANVSILVSNKGRVRLDRIVTYGYLANDGYLYVEVNGMTYSVDSLVCQAFRGAYVNSWKVKHHDSIKTNNRVDNLSWEDLDANAPLRKVGKPISFNVVVTPTLKVQEPDQPNVTILDENERDALEPIANTINGKILDEDPFDVPFFDVLDDPLHIDEDEYLTEMELKNQNIEGEIWKPLPKSLELSKYEVSNMGRIRHIKFGVSNGKISHTGYWYSYLSFDDGKWRNRLHHRLVAYAFHEKPDDKHVVDHIDRNKRNNHSSNLRWVTHSENSLNVTRKKLNQGRRVKQIDPITGWVIKIWNSAKEASSDKSVNTDYYEGLQVGSSITAAVQGKKDLVYGFNWEYDLDEDLENEVWIEHQYNNVTIKVSNMGRIKNMRDCMLKPSAIGDYLKVSVGGKSTSVHRVICRAFHGDPPTPAQNTVNHKDHDTTNNTAENLEWASMAEQIAHQRKPENNHSTGKKVIQYDLKTGVTIEEWPSVKNACETLGLTRDSVYKVVAYGMPSTNGSGWRYA